MSYGSMIGSTCVGSEGLDHNPRLHGLRRGGDEHRMCRSRGSTRQPDWSAGCLVSTNELSLILYYTRACATMLVCIPSPDPPTHVYIHIRTRTHAQSHAHAHAGIQITHALTHKHSHAHVYSTTDTHTTPEYTYTKHTHTHQRARARTHIHTFLWDTLFCTSV